MDERELERIIKNFLIDNEAGLTMSEILKLVEEHEDVPVIRELYSDIRVKIENLMMKWVKNRTAVKYRGKYAIRDEFTGKNL